MNNEEIELKFEDYINIIYNYTLINSLVFAVDIKEYIKNHLKIDNIDKSMLLKGLRSYLSINKNQNIFDNKIKDNFYFLIDYLSEQNCFIDSLEKNSIINDMKIMLNNISCDNLDFIRSQILLRDYGNLHYAWNKAKINKISDQVINRCKDSYYGSISNDFLVINLLLLEKQKFYNQDHKLFLLCTDFYRSINYFTQNYSILFQNLDLVNRIKFIMSEDLKLLINEVSMDNPKIIQKADIEFLNIMGITQKLVKKLDREKR